MYIFVLWILLILAASAEAYELLVIQSQRSPVYDEVLKGLRTVGNFSERVITISDFAEIDVKRIIREDAPRIVVTLGDPALESARKAGGQVPLVPLMAMSYWQGSDNQDLVRGVEMFVPPDRYLDIFKQIKTLRVGVVYCKRRTGNFVRQAQRAAAKLGITLVAREVTSSKEVFAQLDSLKGLVDALWMLPDSTVVSHLTVDGGFARFSMDQNVPLVSFANIYLAHGAAVVAEIDRHDLGLQAGELIVDMLDGKRPLSVVPPRKTVLRMNPFILKRLGIAPEPLNRLQKSWE